MKPDTWLEELEARCVRFGIVVDDLHAIALADAWGLLQFLRRLAGDVDAS